MNLDTDVLTSDGSGDDEENSVASLASRYTIDTIDESSNEKSFRSQNLTSNNFTEKEIDREEKIDIMRLIYELRKSIEGVDQKRMNDTAQLSSKIDELKKSHAEEKAELNSQIVELKISNEKQKENYKVCSIMPKFDKLISLSFSHLRQKFPKLKISKKKEKKIKNVSWKLFRIQ